jgi:hypothetical protein
VLPRFARAWVRIGLAHFVRSIVLLSSDFIWFFGSGSFGLVFSLFFSVSFIV